MIDPSTITGWVQDYKVAGAEALKPKNKDRKQTLDKEQDIRENEEGNSSELKER
ncbi:MAG: helix-turn-helix domain-containing protein [Oscillospiraceae bacterium]|nr:helix-turn-helix domain-containing protein [Oscillospiraceae bacterium]